MIDLDNMVAVRKLDTANVVGSIEQFGFQCEQAWNEVGELKFPTEYHHVQKIVFSGMGGSALGAYVVKSLFLNKLKVPFEIVNDYHLPGFVDEKTLVILSSYSGTTEETLNCAKEAISKKVLLTGITTGGKLGNLFTSNKIPAYVYLPKYNPSNQPRMGLGYSIFGLLAIFQKLKLINLDADTIEISKDLLNKGNLLYGLKTNFLKNPAKKMAQKLLKKIPVIVSAEHLTQVGRVVRNQMHECAKTFAAYHDIPELNHHLMEGLQFPKTNKDTLAFLFINSQNYTERIKKRFSITCGVVSKNGIDVHEFFTTNKNPLLEVVQCLQFGSYLTYYLALFYGIDPSKIPWVDHFKAELAK